MADNMPQCDHNVLKSLLYELETNVILSDSSVSW